MEEKILEIIFKHKANILESTPDYSAAKEIASHFREFIEWVIIHIDATMPQLDYFTKEMNDIDRKETLENMYNYWLKEVKK